MEKRTVFYVSDSTGVTVEEIGRSVLSQFGNVVLSERTFPFINSAHSARHVATRINQAGQSGPRPIVFYTFADSSLTDIIQATDALALDCLDGFIRPLAIELGRAPAHVTNTRAVQDHSYKRRIHALNFTMSHDDGHVSRRLGEADIILVGISRSGKTPTSLYLALHYGVYAANYPLVDEDLVCDNLPAPIINHKKKLYGLIICPKRLQQIRAERLSHSRYAQLSTCQEECDMTLRLFKHHDIPYLDATQRSIEELAAKILQEANIPRYL